MEINRNEIHSWILAYFTGECKWTSSLAKASPVTFQNLLNID